MIQLKYFEHSDFKQLMGWINSPEFLLQWGGPKFEFPLNEQKLEEYIKEANHEQAELYVYKVIQSDTGNVIGHISLGSIDKKNRSGRIGKVLVGDGAIRGQGIGKQMVEAVLEIAFNELKLHRVTLGVFDFNVPAIACYEHVGFVKEGLFRESRRIGDRYWSMWEMSILEREWRERKKRLSQVQQVNSK